MCIYYIYIYYIIYYILYIIYYILYIIYYILYIIYYILYIIYYILYIIYYILYIIYYIYYILYIFFFLIISSIIHSCNITHINKTITSSIGGEVVISPRPDVVAWSPSWASSGTARGRRCPLGAPRCSPLRPRITRVEWNIIQHLDILAGSMLIWRISNEL